MATVKMKCDEKKKEKGEAIFEILDEDEWVREIQKIRLFGNQFETYKTVKTRGSISCFKVDFKNVWRRFLSY